MDTAQIKAYAPKARRDFIEAVKERAGVYGIHGDDAIDGIEYRGDVALIGDRAFTKKEGELRDKLVSRVKQSSFEQVIRAAAYTWFNRFVAIRYMELHDYLDHGYRVLSNTNGSHIPEILEHAADVDLQGLNREKVVELRLAGNRDNELYRRLLVAQCNALHKAMPFLFDRIDSEAELLLPDNLLHTGSPIHNLVNHVNEDQWENVEIIGWIYQFYISEKKDEVIGKVVKSEDIPSATQLFTPNWIVKYMVQNTLGRMWMATHPDSSLKEKMEYYIEPADQDPEVIEQLDAITPEELNPEELTFLDPACGSGHILVEAYDLLKEIYLERAYRTRDIPKLILEKNLHGLDIDDRAAQLASFAVMMKARGDDRRILKRDDLRLNIMSIRETKNLDKNKIVEIISQKPGGNEIQEAVRNLIELFKDGKTFGSLLTIPDTLAEKLEKITSVVDSGESEPEALFGYIAQSQLEQLKPVVAQAEMLAEQYDCVVANPPYMGGKGMNKKLKSWVTKNYPNSKSDLMTCFMERAISLCQKDKLWGMINLPSWMFLSSFEKLRNTFLTTNSINTLLHLGRGIFGSDFGTIAFTCINSTLDNQYQGTYRRLFEKHVQVRSVEKIKSLFLDSDYGKYIVPQYNLGKIPGSPIAYWVSVIVANLFQEKESVVNHFPVNPGIRTGKDTLFLRLWHEISNTCCQFNLSEATQMLLNKKWFPLHKGGSFRKWYGNAEHVIDLYQDGIEIKTKSPDFRLRDKFWYFKPFVSWSRISSAKIAFRYFDKGVLFSDAGPGVFAKEQCHDVMGLLNSKLGNFFLNIINPTLNYQKQDIEAVPYVNLGQEENIRLAVEITKTDWDSYETSWDFANLPIQNPTYRHPTLIKNYYQLRTHWQEVTLEMQQLEEENNRIFINAYGLQDELTPDVPLNEITLTCNPRYRYGNNKTDDEYETLLLTDTMKELVSYSVGCMMGRYSLDEPGLIYANSGNKGFDPSRYATFPADEDGIIPIMDQDWFDDDATRRFVEFMSAAWSPDTLDENLKFVAESLKPKNGEEPVDTIRRYFSTSFFKDHMKTYKKRPVYWLFSSGKNRAFECLVYLHRYNESTLSRMRSLYVTPLQGNYGARIEYLRNEKESATTASAQKKFQKEMDLLKKKQVELAAFDDELRHYADMKISLDLDDGVKVNYGKFGKLLAEKKAITGKK